MEFIDGLRQEVWEVNRKKLSDVDPTDLDVYFPGSSLTDRSAVAAAPDLRLASLLPRDGGADVTFSVRARQPRPSGQSHNPHTAYRQ